MKEIALEKVVRAQAFKNELPLTKEEITAAYDFSKEKIEKFMFDFTERFPKSASVNNIYPAVENNEWTCSFHTGMLWLFYETTGDERFKEVAKKQVLSFKNRIDNNIATDTHDLGFLYTLSCVADYRITGDEAAKQIAIDAADALMLRYKPKGEFIQAWGSITDPKNYRLIIDCLLNLPLLYWAAEVTDEKKYYEVATKHLHTAMANVIRPDASTFHTFYFDPETGAPDRGTTHQGYSDDSCWARGQTWGITGLAYSYAYTKDESLIAVYKKLTNYFLNRLPEDDVAYWDLVFTDGDQPRDSSADAIAVCGMLEMDQYLDDADEDKAIYRGAIAKMMRSLFKSYTTKDFPESNGILIHGVYNLPSNMGVDECTIWGDYYYVEALVRMMKDWKMYW